MSMEAVQRITEAEQAGRTRQEEAAAEGGRIVGEAERVGRQRVERARAEAEEAVKAMMADAEERAAEYARRSLADNDAVCARIKQGARTRLEQAADLIVTKVGAADGNC